MSICGEIDQQSLNISMTPLSLNCEEYSGILTFGNVILRPSMLFIYSFIYLSTDLAKQTSWLLRRIIRFKEAIGHYLNHLRV